MTSTIQLTLEGNVSYNATCKYCGKKFNKTANKQCYCCDDCRSNALREQKAEYQRNRRKLVREGVLIVSEKEKGNITNGGLLEHRFEDFEREYRAIQREKKRLKLK